VSPDGKHLFVTNQDDDRVSVSNTSSGGKIAEIEVGEAPRGIDITPDGRHVYVAN
jgi:YVTN family beta-propeller protein